ncbi:metallophosphoesterase [Ectopseudomonas oleovorans]|uniref:Calcineurin-like phosphoesterase family protein n=1 Tax=Ectopseudomonas oleovorans TaxID=301 RepID=A0A3D9EFY5_ECTOL|nr:metallophosphoesterase [Pseudomonas oleovorans]RED02049.1 calcineurin-like phosphoesterase family protein [Pseudomonas oleovorans]
MKSLSWLHISDIHFSAKAKWRDEHSLETLIECLEAEFESGDLPYPDLIFCTGDVAYGEAAGESLVSQYEQAAEFFENLLSACGKGAPLPNDRLFIIPGNHDVNRKSINKDAQSALIGKSANSDSHRDEINQRLADNSQEMRQCLVRLNEYSGFVEKHFPHLAQLDGMCIHNSKIVLGDICVGVAGLNTAWSCSGPEDDRNLWMGAQWQFNKARTDLKGCDIRIALMHHPIDWLNEAERKTCRPYLDDNFDFTLHGHTHDAWVSPSDVNICVGAGATGARTSEEFGFNFVKIDFEKNVADVHLYKRTRDSSWTIAPLAKHAPKGIWRIDLSTKKNLIFKKKISDSPTGIASAVDQQFDFALKTLENRLFNSLKLFNNYQAKWIDRVISRSPEEKHGSNKTNLVAIHDIVSGGQSYVIKAPPQHGLSCLAHEIARYAWATKKQLWIVLDTHSLKPNKDSISQNICNELANLDLTNNHLYGVIIDSFSPSKKDHVKILDKIESSYLDLKIIVMFQLEVELMTAMNVSTQREYETVYLWSLPRNTLRSLISDYNHERELGEEDAVVSRIILDLEVLNLHRTPFNCITLLKASELNFDESPVNRAEIIKRVLSLLFNTEKLPSYQTQPDLKDCEYVLGYFCETIIRTGDQGFTLHSFLSKARACCGERLIDLDTKALFDILFTNNIIVQRGSLFYFKFSYWIFYFAAQRMSHSDEFTNFIYEDMRYAQHTEIIEFYTGTDRSRNDAIRVLIRDLRKARLQVSENCGIPDDINPYKLGRWNAGDDVQQQMHDEIASGVADSSLPKEIKDQYADKLYDPARPYNQNINSVLGEFSFVRMLQGACAGSRALRNSDYVLPELKRELFQEIMACWHETSKILFVVLPLLVQSNHVSYDGVSIIYKGDHSDDLYERFMVALLSIPNSIASKFSDDLFSMKMGPLFYDQLSSEKVSEISRHELMLLILSKRPRDWEEEVQKYIYSVQHNSFYLMDTYNQLRLQYKYSFASPETLSEIAGLMRIAILKHETGKKKPTSKDVAKSGLKLTLEREDDI